eukprot:TRINITY_DN8457_c0_g1_i2.p1 TRINITY_DN8457_c0_g1~~TRINITY_DN8457_c0_g1_i2.p1  ORF type:complete len:749 (-),score=100.96 TRINITY_DN8457_c0_g1_i2:2291-4279(-)
MGNIEPGSGALWCHLIFLFIFSLFAYVLLFREYKRYIRIRLRYLNQMQPKSYTIMLKEIPKSLNNKDELIDWFEEYYPCKVVDCQMVYQARKLRKLKAERLDYVKRLEKANWILENKGKRDKIRTGFKHRIGKKVDAISYCEKKIQQLEIDIKAKQVDKKKRTKVGFVTFDSVFMARVKAFPLRNPGQMIAIPAPEPEDVLWKWLNTREPSRIARTLVVNIVTFLLIFFWSIPIIIIQGFSNLETIVKIAPFLEGLVDLNSYVRAFIEGYLPTLAVVVFMAVLVPFIKLIVTLQGLTTKSEVERSIMNKYWAFLLVNVFLVITVAGGIFHVLDSIIDDPASIPELLAKSLPQQSLPFMLYIFIRGLSGYPLQMLRLIPFVIRLIKKKFFAKTDREKLALNLPEPFLFSRSVARELLIITIVLSYSVMAPLILLFGVFYFALAYLSNRFNLIYVHDQGYEGGGINFPPIARRIVLAIGLFQVVMIGMFSVSIFPVGVIFALLLPFITFLYWTYLEERMYPIAEYGAIEVNPLNYDADVMIDAYLQPSMWPNPEDINDIMRDPVYGQKAQLPDDGVWNRRSAYRRMSWDKEGFMRDHASKRRPTAKSEYSSRRGTKSALNQELLSGEELDDISFSGGDSQGTYRPPSPSQMGWDSEDSNETGSD